MGPGALLAPEQGVILETDPAKAREMARGGVANYLRLPNYVNAWKRLGFSDSEITGLDDRLIDQVFAWGDLEAIRRRVQAHLDAGADHVCLQVIKGPLGVSKTPPMDDWRELAKLL